jgi:Histidine kinase-, DNA gyrase B-, and HSP90-like ATPase
VQNTDHEPVPELAAPIAAALAASSTPEPDQELHVEITYEVVQVLSEQLYATPLKAIEELVVNAWDADATECRVHVPSPEGLAASDPPPFVAVLDNGHGMTVEELRELWHVGDSPKRGSKWRGKRTQIGKFGIGKLASYVIARRVTYITRADPKEDLRAVTLDFDRFRVARDEDGVRKAIDLDMLRVPDIDALLSSASVSMALAALGTSKKELASKKWDTWTLVVLEELKEKARDIKPGRLRWVLRTAMPLARDFDLRLNGAKVESAKADYTWLVDFNVGDLEPERLESLTETTGVHWKKQGESLVSERFPSGVKGRVRVADRSLYASTKSDDLGRSHGFFIRVRGRLINEDDPLFGASPMSFTTFYNLSAEIEADDLDAYLKAPRDDIEDTTEREQFRDLLGELFRQARNRYDAVLREQAEKEREAKEGKRAYVDTRLVERPVADALVNYREDQEPPGEWIYLRADTDEKAVQELVANLYTDEPARPQYAYKYRAAGKGAPLVEFDPAQSAFWLNEDHELVVENHEDVKSRRLLEAVATAEALLEVYMRELGLAHPVVEHILSRRDELLRSLAHDELYSVTAIAASLEAAANSATELEVAVVATLRALGFGTQHISGSGTPDGVAEYIAYGAGETSFTLEAKSSKDVPELGHLDFGMLREHYEGVGGKGCLLVAPDFPGRTKGDDSAVAKMAMRQQISCWTVEQLARVVRLAEARHINAEDIQSIVLASFTPDQVDAAVEKLLSEPSWDRKNLYRAIVDTLDKFSGVLQGSPRDIGMLTGQIALAGFDGIERKDVKEAVEQLAKASQGMLHVTRGDRVHVSGHLDELRRRVAYLTGDETAPRRKGSFRNHDEAKLEET